MITYNFASLPALLLNAQASENPLKNILWIMLLLAVVPAITLTLKNNANFHYVCLWNIVFWTCHIKKPLYMELFFVSYRGVDRGFGVTVADFFFFGYFLFLLLKPEKKIICPYNFLWLCLLFAISILSLTKSQHPYYGLFTIHKLLRSMILFWVIVNIIKTRKDLNTVIFALICVVFYEMVVVIWSKYVTRTNVVQTPGTFPHQNGFAMYLNLFLPVLLTMVMMEVCPLPRKLVSSALLVGMVLIIFTKSRGGLIMMIFGLAMTSGICFLRKPTARKIQVLLMGAIVSIALGAVAAPKIIQRFQTAPKESAETRKYFNVAAKAMADDSIFGVGINMYSYALANSHYYWYVYPDFDESEDDPDDFRETHFSRLGVCHHIYFLWAAECGWIAMYVFLLIIARFYWLKLTLIIKIKDEYCCNVIIGFLAGFTTFHLQGLLEWAYRTTNIIYIFHVLSGVIVSIYLRHHTTLAQSPETTTKHDTSITITTPAAVNLIRKNLTSNSTMLN